MQKKSELANLRHELQATLITGRMKWYCQETGIIAASIPVTEPMNKPVYCICCGKRHLLVPGELSGEDRTVIDQLKSVQAEEDTLEWLGQVA